MMTLQQIQSSLQKHKPILQQQFNVQDIGIFGSYSVAQASDHSDIDVLVNFSQPIGWKIVDLQNYLEDVFQKKIDLVTSSALKPQLREKILNQVVYA